jgi:hypothetical protein
MQQQLPRERLLHLQCGAQRCSSVLLAAVTLPTAEAGTGAALRLLLLSLLQESAGGSVVVVVLLLLLLLLQLHPCEQHQQQ